MSMRSVFSSLRRLTPFSSEQSIGAHSTNTVDEDVDKALAGLPTQGCIHPSSSYASSSASVGITQRPQDASTAWMATARSRFPMQHPAGADSARNACQRMDEEIIAIEKLLLFSRRHRNALAAISVLPPEVILEVIHLLKRDWISQDGTPEGVMHDSKPRLPYQLGWITITHVCHQWRQLALDHSSLWADVLCCDMSPSWAFEMIRRSRMAPKLLDINMDRYEKPEASLAILKFALEPPSLPSLRVLNVQSSDIQSVTSLFTQPMPGLETVALREPPGDRIVLFPPTLFVSLAPSLKHLTLTQCSIHWDAINYPVLPNLTHLSIEFYAPLKVTTRLNCKLPSHQQLARFFAGMPKLEDLDLTDAIPYMQPAFVQQWDVSTYGVDVHLAPGLKRLCLTGVICAVGCIRLAISTVFSPSTRLELFVAGRQPAATLSTLLQKFAGSSRPPKTLQFSFQHQPDVEMFTLDFNTWDDLYQTNRQDSLTPSIPSQFSLAFDVSDVEDPVHSLCEGLNLDELVDVMIHNERRGLSRTQWLSIFRPARKVRRVEFEDLATAFKFVEMLLESHNDPFGTVAPGDSVPRSPVLFPALDTLIFTDDTDLHHPPSTGLPRQDVIRLLAVLEVRARLGTHIQHLFLPSRFEEEEWAPRVKELVSDVRFCK